MVFGKGCTTVIAVGRHTHMLCPTMHRKDSANSNADKKVLTTLVEKKENQLPVVTHHLRRHCVFLGRHLGGLPVFLHLVIFCVFRFKQSMGDLQ